MKAFRHHGSNGRITVVGSTQLTKACGLEPSDFVTRSFGWQIFHGGIDASHARVLAGAMGTDGKGLSGLLLLLLLLLLRRRRLLLLLRLVLVSLST